MYSRSRFLAAALTLGVIGSVALVATSQLAADPPGGAPKVFHVDTSPYGTSYGDWAAAWWQWALSFPPDNSPLFDDTGDKAGLGQSGPVYFLAGTFFPGGTVTRDITIPKGKALFFPILNFEYDNLLCFDPNTDLSMLDMRDFVAGLAENATEMFCDVDGHDIDNIKEKFRVVSPEFSLYPTVDGLCTDEPAGVAVPAVGDGYYIMLKPLKVGEHVLHFGGSLPDIEVSLDITYNITVTE